MSTVSRINDKNTALFSDGKMGKPWMSGLRITTRTKESKVTLFVPTDRRPTHPGEFLRDEFIEPMGLIQREVADALHISEVGLNLLLNGKKRLTAQMALRLERAFGVSAQTWLNMQIACDLYAAQHSSAAGVIEAEVRQLVHM